MVALGRLRAETGFDVPQAFPIGQLCEGHAQELVETTEGAHVEIASVLRYLAKGMPGCELHHLGEHELADMHHRLPDKSG
jgi:hypothetical protein